MMMRWRIEALFGPEEGGVGGGSGAGGAGGATGSGGAAGAAGGSGGAGQAGAQPAGDGGSLAAAAEAAKGQAGAAAGEWFPKGLDEKFKGKDAGETLTNLAKHIAEQPKAPAAAKDYQFKPADTIAQFFGSEVDNKVLDVARGAAHELGLTQGQFDGFINKFYGAAIEKGMIAKPVDVMGEFTALGGKDGTPAEIGVRGQQRVLAVRDSLVGLETAGVLAKGEAALLTSAMTRAGEVIGMERLVKALETARGSGGPLNGGQPGDGLSEHERALRTMYPSMFRQQ